MIHRILAPLLLLGVAAPALTQPAASPVLPPVRPWSGKSLELTIAPEHPWATPFEASGLERTPRYEQTMAWLERLAATAPELEIVSLGKSAEGREIPMVIASREGAATPEALRANGRPILLAHAGIHSGEIDGKDAGMMLLRDMTVLGTRRALLDRANLLFIPILSVDGHERFSPFSRVNQRGPVEMGWRTNARNLNLNRDFTKLETEELRALVAAINAWRPDLYFDLHVTDGADYQYDITYGYNGTHAWSPNIARWLDQVFTPATDAALEQWGHVPGPLTFGFNGRDMTAGTVAWTASPRFSNGWGDARHLPTVLVENHSLKPYNQRVLGTYVLLESALTTLGRGFRDLRAARAKDEQSPRRGANEGSPRRGANEGSPRRGANEGSPRRGANEGSPEEIVLAWGYARPDQLPTTRFKGVRSELYLSPISGAPEVRWTGEPVVEEIPVYAKTEARVSVRRPTRYYIPAAWHVIAEKLEQQGIEVARLETPATVEVEMIRLPDAALDVDNTPFEGRARYTSGAPIPRRRSLDLPAGSFRVDTGQALGTLAVLMLEPESPDSLFQWGYFAAILQRTEYVEGYVMEPTAHAMLAADPALAAEFEQKLLADRDFAADPRARLQWFYRKTPFFDSRHRLYPVARGID